MRLIDVPGRPRRWLWLLTVAVVMAATATVVLGGSPRAIRPAATQAGIMSAGSLPGGSGGVPRFYLTVSSNGTAAPPRVQVHRSRDAEVTGMLLSPPGWRIQEVSAAADDRTFVVAESGLGTCPADRFFRFSVMGTGALTGLRQVAALADGMVEALAVSPDGTRLAFVSVCTTLAHPGPVWILHVIDLASGAVTTWTNAVTAADPGDVAEINGDSLAWTADGRSLSVAYQWMPYAVNQADLAVLLLNPSGGSGTLQAHGRLVWHQVRGCVRCVSDAWISPDGRYLVAAATAGAIGPGAYRLVLERIALPAGRVAAVLFSTTIVSRVNGIPALPLWGDGSGKYWLVYAGTRLGWVSDGQFHPLQPLGSVYAAAW